MENQHQKWVSFSYLAAAALFGYIVFAFAMQMAGTYDLEARFRQIDLVIQIASIAISIILFLVLYRNQKANEFMSEVVLELSRVTWPAQKETMSATMIVIIMVLISGMILGLLDYVWTKLVQWVL